jgi:hypothetical protein
MGMCLLLYVDSCVKKSHCYSAVTSIAKHEAKASTIMRKKIQNQYNLDNSTQKFIQLELVLKNVKLFQSQDNGKSHETSQSHKR